MPAVREILIGRRTGDHVVLTVRGRLFPDGADADWLWVSLTVGVDGFACQRDGNVHVAELGRFRTALERLHEAEATQAGLSTEDGWLEIAMTRDGAGSVESRVRVRADDPRPAELRCVLADLGPAGLMATIESLTEVERAYPAGQTDGRRGTGRPTMPS